MLDYFLRILKMSLVHYLIQIHMVGQSTQSITQLMFVFGWLFCPVNSLSLPISEQMASLVMIFDMSELKSFLELREWVSCKDIQKFDIMVCIGNKVDLLPGPSISW